MGCQKCILIAPKKLLRFCCKKKSSYSDLQEKVFCLSSKIFFGKGSQNCIQLVPEKNFFFKKKYFSNHFRFFNKTFPTSWQKNFSSFVKTAFYVSRGTCRGFFAEKISLSCLDINWNIISLLANVFQQVWQNWILSVHKNFLEELLSAEKYFLFHRFRTSEETKKTFWGKLFRRIVKAATCGSRETLWLNTFLEEVLFFYHFGSLRKKMSAFWQKIFNRVLKAAFYVSTKTFWSLLFRRIYFFETILNIRRQKLRPRPNVHGSVVNFSV